MVSASSPSVGERPLFSNVTRLGFAAAHDSPALKIEEARILPKTDAASNSSTVSGNIQHNICLYILCAWVLDMRFLIWLGGLKSKTISACLGSSLEIFQLADPYVVVS